METEWKTKEQFNCCDWSDYYAHKYQAKKVKTTWFYKF